MKKSVAQILSIFIVILMVTMTACSGQLENYSYYWTSSGKYSIGAVETLTYAVKQNNSFKTGDYDFAKKSESKVELGHSGIYVTELSAITTSGLCEKAQTCLNSSIALAGSTSSFYKNTTSLNVLATYKYQNGNTYEFNDQITSECYFTDCAHHLTPLYSIKSYNTTVLSETDVIYHYVYDTEIFYQNGKATINVYDKTTEVTPSYKEDSNYVLAPTTSKSRTINYKEQEILDNEQLVLLGRALDFSTQLAHQVNVMDSTYLRSNVVKTTMAENVTEYLTNSVENPFFFQVNGLDQELSGSVKSPESNIIGVDVNTVLYMLSDQHFTGLPFVCYYQRTDNKPSINSRTIPIKMYSSLAFLNGALEYELRAINITE